MERATSFWIRGRAHRDAVVNALLESGYQVRLDLDKESELLNGKPSYLIAIVQPEYDGYYFEPISELDTVKKHDEEEEE